MVEDNEVLTEYTCVRCGYKYNKRQDWEPFLCHRCMRYISKKVYTVMQTIQPATSTTTSKDV